MKIYNALIKKSREGKIEDVVVLKEGFSFPAFFFSGLWFLYHRMWHEFFVLLLIILLFGSSNSLLSGFDKGFLQFAFFLIIALNANYWRCEHLKKNGYEFVGLVFGTDLDNAKLRFVSKYEVDENPEFADSILNPKLHRKMMKLQKKRLLPL